MKKQQSGFTLIELVVVIVILGILAATAIPKFVDLSTEAGNAAANGVAGALASGTAANYAAKMANKSGTTVLTAANVCDAETLQPLVSGIKFVDASTTPTTPGNGNEYLVSGTGDCSAAGAPGTAVTCDITGYKGAAQKATVICSN